MNINTLTQFQLNPTHLVLDEVELSGTRVHQRVEVLVAGELGLDESTDVSLRQETVDFIKMFNWNLKIPQIQVRPRHAVIERRSDAYGHHKGQCKKLRRNFLEVPPQKCSNLSKRGF